MGEMFVECVYDGTVDVAICCGFDWNGAPIIALQRMDIMSLIYVAAIKAGYQTRG